MKEIVEQFLEQKVIVRLAVNWQVIGRVVGVKGETVEIRDESGVSTFVNISRIITIEPYRTKGGSGHYI